MACLDVLDDDVGEEVGGRLAGVDRVLERLEDVLPANDGQGVDVLAEERCDRRRGSIRSPSSSRRLTSTMCCSTPAKLA